MRRAEGSPSGAGAGAALARRWRGAVARWGELGVLEVMSVTPVPHPRDRLSFLRLLPIDAHGPHTTAQTRHIDGPHPKPKVRRARARPAPCRGASAAGLQGMHATCLLAFTPTRPTLTNSPPGHAPPTGPAPPETPGPRAGCVQQDGTERRRQERR